VKLGKNASDSCAVLSEVYGEKLFKEGRENVEDVEKVRNLVHSV
jgi:hypothetical protein